MGFNRSNVTVGPARKKLYMQHSHPLLNRMLNLQRTRLFLRTINNVAELAQTPFTGWKFKELHHCSRRGRRECIRVSATICWATPSSRDNSVETLPWNLLRLSTDMEEIVALIESAVYQR